jgi:hypothetical protein
MAVIAALAAPLGADSSVPPPPGVAGAWTGRCAERLRAALRGLVQEEPDFASGRVTLDEKKRVVRFEALVPDREHARFYAGAPAHYWARIEEKRSEKPGELGADVGSPKDSQASVGAKVWSKERFAEYDVQIAEGRKAFRFSFWFSPAVRACLE